MAWVGALRGTAGYKHRSQYEHLLVDAYPAQCFESVSSTDYSRWASVKHKIAQG